MVDGQDIPLKRISEYLVPVGYANDDVIWAGFRLEPPRSRDPRMGECEKALLVHGGGGGGGGSAGGLKCHALAKAGQK